jgi:3-deoxy-D-manno-octulosonic-acid transferase
VSGWSRASASEWLALSLYSFALRLLQPAYALKLWRRGAAEPAYRTRIAERFGFYANENANAGVEASATASVNPSGWLWLHAVSLGETRAAAALVAALRLERPGLRVLLTHGTATGLEAGAALLQAGDRQTWLPYDTPGATRRFIARFRPAAGVLMETEVWPNLLLAAQAGGVPMVLANARLSEKSLRRGQRFAVVLRPAIASLSGVLAQSEADAQRLRLAGARAVEVCGNLKYDLAPEPSQLERGAAWRALLGRPVVLAAITREGEERSLLDAWTSRPRGDALLLIVPRHPQRFDAVESMVRGAGLGVVRRSTWGDTPAVEALTAQVWLGDSMREMAQYYASADVALLGGSFAPLGGHNLIEAAACGCPLVMGPSTFNFAEAAALSLAAGASVRVAGMAEAVEQATGWLQAPARLREIAANARAFAAQHRGAARRMAQRIAPMLPD